MSNDFVKDPDAVLDYQWDWSDWLAESETISTATVTAPDGITLASTAKSANAVTAWLSGGTAGVDYEVTCRIVTNQSRTDDRTIRIACRNR
jgi:hypothetical protein